MSCMAIHIHTSLVIHPCPIPCMACPRAPTFDVPSMPHVLGGPFSLHSLQSVSEVIAFVDPSLPTSFMTCPQGHILGGLSWLCSLSIGSRPWWPTGSPCPTWINVLGGPSIPHVPGGHSMPYILCGLSMGPHYWWPIHSPCPAWIHILGGPSTSLTAHPSPLSFTACPWDCADDPSIPYVLSGHSMPFILYGLSTGPHQWLPIHSPCPAWLHVLGGHTLHS